MIAMSTVITVVTATAMQLKINSGNQNLIKELYDHVGSNPNYPIIPTTYTNRIVNSEHTKDNSKKWRSSNSKLVQLLDHLLLMNTCVSDNRQLPHKTSTLSKPDRKFFRNTTHFKHYIFFNYLRSENHMS